jgi:hypothetical protein
MCRRVAATRWLSHFGVKAAVDELLSKVPADRGHHYGRRAAETFHIAGLGQLYQPATACKTTHI